MFFHRLVPLLSCLLAALACTSDRRGSDVGAPVAASSPAVVRDDFGDTIPVGRTFERIVSLNPTTTEALFAMGAGARLIGRSHWDQWPTDAQRLPDLGPGIRPNLEVVLAARPDLVLLYASADNRLVAQRLRAAGIATYSSKVDAIGSFRDLVHVLGRLVGDTARARSVTDSVDRTLDSVRRLDHPSRRPRVLIPAWESPLLVIGGGSHMSELVEVAGGDNVYADRPEPSPQVAFEDVVRRDPDVILVSPAGRARLLANPQWQSLRAVRAGRVFAYDTMVVGRPSVTMGGAAVNLASLLQRLPR